VVTLTRRAGTALAVLAVIVSGGRTALAQEPRIEVRVTVPPEVIREVHRIVETAVGPQMRAEISQAIRDAATELSSISREITREIGREIGREVGRDRDQDRRFPAEQIDKETRTIALGPNGSLDLKNISGDITITGGNGKDVTLDITRRSRGRTDADAKMGLEQVKVEIDHRGDRATVETRYPDQQGRTRQPYSVSVSYNIAAPAGTRMNVTSISGDVIVKGMKGDLSIDVVSGDLQITQSTRLTNVKSISGTTTITDVDADGNLTFGGVSGDVTLQRVKARRLSVNLISGDIKASDVTAEGVELKSMSGTVNYSGPVAKSGRYELQAHSGDVYVAIQGNVGFDLRAETFSGSIRADASVNLKETSRSRQALRGPVGDGSAVVVATTFSGDVIITRR
jgi:hypothetical protein